MTKPRANVIDTHAHLDDAQFDGDRDTVIARAATAGVSRIINIGYRPDRWKASIELAERYPSIAYTLGLHPHHAGEWSPSVESELLALLKSGGAIAIGEVGLDYFRNLTPPETQRAVFHRQLEIAADLRLPVVIHQRAAENDLIDVLRSCPTDLTCVLHSFDGTAALARFAIERGFYIGIGGLMTRSGASEVRDVLRTVPLDTMLLETDSPYLVPAGVKQRRNEPANVALVALRLAELHGMDVDGIASATTANAGRVFGKSFVEAHWDDQ